MIEPCEPDVPKLAYVLYAAATVVIEPGELGIDPSVFDTLPVVAIHPGELGVIRLSDYDPSVFVHHFAIVQHVDVPCVDALPLHISPAVP